MMIVPRTHPRYPSPAARDDARSRGKSRNRRGSIYVVTLSTTMIVAALAITALSMVRIDRRRAGDSESTRQAEIYAQSALEMAKYRLRTDASYRTKLASGTWATDQAIGGGYYSFTGVDPVDGNLTNGTHDPILITAVGKSGGSVQRIAARFEFEQPGLPCMKSALYGDKDVNFDKVTATILSGPATANQKLKADHDSVVTADCEAVETIETKNGATIVGSTTTGVTAQTLPDATTIFDGYSSVSTTILATALPLWDRELLTNPGAETGATSPWSILLGSLSTSTDQERSGGSSFKASSRVAVEVVPFQTISSSIAQNLTYDVRGYVLVDADNAVDDFRLKIAITTSSGTTEYTSDWVTAEKDTWKQISFAPTLTWSGTLLGANLSIESKDLNKTFFFDDMSMTEAGAQPNTYVIHRRLISPSSNPFTGVLNTNGIYKLNCGGNNINIRDSRIYGTLIISDPGSTSRIEGSIVWHPKVYLSANPSSANLPALLVDKKIEIGLASAPLSEATLNLNLNPTGAPWNGGTDSDKSDTYPSQICGVVYSSDDLLLSDYTSILGNVLSLGKVDVKASAPSASGVTISHLPLYYYANPPHGFRAAPIVRLKNGSVEQVLP